MKHLAFSLGLAALALAGCQSTHTAEMMANDNCPYSGNPVDPALSITVGNKEVRTCCNDCLDMAKKDPEKAVAKAFPNQ